jgi:RNA polymerase sigma-70 factor (ECF subfamily)
VFVADHRTEGAGPAQFPETSWSGILAAKDRSAPDYVERVNRLAALYWRPVYWYIRLQWNKPHEACKDLAQAFFAQMLEKDVFRLADPAKGSFRGFLRAVLKHFLLVEKRAAGRQKRGGGKSLAPLVMDDIQEGRVMASSKGRTPDELFDREWSRSVLDEAYRRLETQAKAEKQTEAYEAFRTYYLDAPPGAPPSYADVAKALKMSEFTLQNRLYAMRQMLKKIVREIVEDSAGNAAQTEAELRDLLLED